MPTDLSVHPGQIQLESIANVHISTCSSTKPPRLDDDDAKDGKNDDSACNVKIFGTLIFADVGRSLLTLTKGLRVS